MIKKLSISSKLFLVVAIPILGFLLFAVSKIVDSNSSRANIEEFYKLYEITHPANNLIFQLQKEREQLVIKDKKIDYLVQREETDKKLTDFLKKIKDVDVEYLELNKMKKIYFSFSDELKTFRNNYDRNINTVRPEEFYGKKIEQLIFLSEFIALSSLDTEISTLASARLNILKIIEKAYGEKTLLLNVFSKGEFGAEDFNNFNHLRISQKTLIDNFKYFADSEHKELFIQNVENRYEEYKRYIKIASSMVKKTEIISEIRDVLGYGGFIHNFKNFVARGDKRYLVKANEDYAKLESLKSRYLKIEGVTHYEKVKINTVITTLSKYKRYLDSAEKRRLGSVGYEDSKTRYIIDDEALDALSELSKNSVGLDASLWDTESTSRIEILQEIEGSLSDKLLAEIVNFKYTAIASLIFLLFVTFAVAVVTIVAIYLLVSKLNESLGNLEIGLNDFIRYMIYKDTIPKDIEIISDDIIGVMSRNINENIQLIKVCQKIDENVINEVSIALNKAKVDINTVEEIKCFADNIFLEDMKFDFNEMIKILKERTEELNSYKTNLENKIRNKTKELEETYKDLEISTREIKNYNKLLEEDKKRLSDFSKYLSKIQSVDVDTIVKKAIKYISNMTNSIFSRFYLYDNNELTLIQNGGILEDSNYYDFKELGILKQAIDSNKWIKVEDISEDALEPIDLGVGLVRFTTFYAIPVIFNKKKLGVLVFGGLKEVDEEFLDGYIQAFGSALSGGVSYKFLTKQSEDLEIVNKELSKSERIKNKFFFNVSYGLKKPLEEIIEISSNIQPDLSDKQKAKIEKVKKDSKKILHLMKDIQDFSQIETGKISLESTDVNLVELIKECTNELTQKAYDKNVVLTSDIRVGEEKFVINTDRGKLKKVILTLAGNGISYVAPDVGKVTIVLFDDDENTIVAVKDNGIGIPEEDQASVFDPFEKFDISDDEQISVGLGLTLSKSIVELLGGTIELESEVGKGSVFGIVLPGISK